MKLTGTSILARIGMAAALTMLAPLAKAETITPGYNFLIPENIMTPDQVKTPIGTMHFSDGMPDAASVTKLYDNLDLIRSEETFLNGIPAASLESMKEGAARLGVNSSNKVLIMDQLMDAAPLFLTGNAETVYIMTFLDLKKSGPIVVEVPPGAGPGTVDDAYFRFVVDMGGPGPDRGKGGKYLILPPDYSGPIQCPVNGAEQTVDGQKYYVAKSTSYTNLVILRGFTVAGDPVPATKMWNEGFKVYPLSQSASPPKMEFISGSGKSYNTIHANNDHFYEELNTVVQYEPVSMWDPEMLGLFASIGIEKGKPFAPDARMQAILVNAAAIGNATARALFFQPRAEGSYLYPHSAWATAFLGGSYEWLNDGGNGGRNLDARTLFFYAATVNTPAMALKMPGVGSQYAYAAKDADGHYLDGAKTYKLHIPANPPAKNFWSVVVYDPQTRSELQTSQKFPSKASGRDKMTVNKDGSIDLYYGPKAPAGEEANWTETVPGKNWFVLLRLYGPLEPWFDKTWRPGEFQLVK